LFWLRYSVLAGCARTCRRFTGRAAEISLDISGYVWILSGYPDIQRVDVWISGYLDIQRLGYVWICPDMSG